MYNLTNANKHFEDVKILRSKIEGDFTIINTKLKALRKIYSEIVIKHSKIDCTLGVDALFFQSELIDKEYSNLQQMFNFINNRIYCEYYKLYYYQNLLDSVYIIILKTISSLVYQQKNQTNLKWQLLFPRIKV